MWTEVYRRLERLFPAFEVDQWWGITDPFERMAGSVLVQNTTWTNAAKALDALRQRGLATPERLAATDMDELAAVIRPAGFQQAKSGTLIRLARWVTARGGVPAIAASGQATEALRAELLQLKGIGPETADTILAYALKRPTISGDAYSRRLHLRLTGRDVGYDGIRRAILAELSGVEALAKLHGLIVEHGKAYCRKHSPQCSACPLATECAYACRLITQTAE